MWLKGEFTIPAKSLPFAPDLELLVCYFDMIMVFFVVVIVYRADQNPGVMFARRNEIF